MNDFPRPENESQNDVFYEWRKFFRICIFSCKYMHWPLISTCSNISMKSNVKSYIEKVIVPNVNPSDPNSIVYYDDHSRMIRKYIKKKEAERITGEHSQIFRRTSIDLIGSISVTGSESDLLLFHSQYQIHLSVYWRQIHLEMII